MLTISMLSMSLVVLLATITLLSAVTTRQCLQPATVNPFGPMHQNPELDTLPNGTASESTLNGDWQSAELSRLCDVEMFLDSLEAKHICRTELELNSNDRFTVRWR